ARRGQASRGTPRGGYLRPVDRKRRADTGRTPRGSANGRADRRGGAAEVVTREIETPQGVARVHLHSAEDPRAALVLGHGAGGGVQAPDLLAATAAAGSQGIT